jgi:hypothetical protein
MGAGTAARLAGNAFEASYKRELWEDLGFVLISFL